MTPTTLLDRAERLLKQHKITFCSLKRSLSAVEEAWYDEQIAEIDAWKRDKAALANPITVAIEDVPRCEVCKWPLATSVNDGCVPGNCSYRPRAKR